MNTIENLLSNVNQNRPTLLVDADEVLLRFVERLEAYFHSNGLELRLTSFQLAGNIYDAATGAVVTQKQVPLLLQDFFDTCVDDIAPVQGAADALADLSTQYQIVVLSNVPSQCRERRAKSLAAHGIDFPVIANKGPKGPVVKLFDDATKHQTVFIDDLPPQHASVAEHCPESHRVHFVADSRLAKLIGKAPEAHVRNDDWPQLTAHLKSLLDT